MYVLGLFRLVLICLGLGLIREHAHMLNLLDERLGFNMCMNVNMNMHKNMIMHQNMGVVVMMH